MWSLWAGLKNLGSQPVANWKSGPTMFHDWLSLHCFEGGLAFSNGGLWTFLVTLVGAEPQDSGGDATVEVGSPITSATGPNPPIVGGLHGLKLLVILHLWFVIKSNVSSRLPRKMCLGSSAFGSPCFIQPAAQPRQLRSKEFPAWPGHRVGWGGEIGYPAGNFPKIDK